MSASVYFVYWTQLHAEMPPDPERPDDGIRRVVFLRDYQEAMDRADRLEAQLKLADLTTP